ncbi:hypothetical protein K227x_19360 [Rubripirellula lacrimiformis]|uniref:Uncharacterized protein n=1 Tax=Rubripirellula lacrimiformis TaxID=1930273 RepID=A0A517N8V9_9BACT|nr:hypothetical protein K227x_19360 [Rubripirellula lacrimiformis]
MVGGFLRAANLQFWAPLTPSLSPRSASKHYFDGDPGERGQREERLQIEQCKFVIGGMVGGFMCTANLQFWPPHPIPLPRIRIEALLRWRSGGEGAKEGGSRERRDNRSPTFWPPHAGPLPQIRVEASLRLRSGGEGAQEGEARY